MISSRDLESLLAWKEPPGRAVLSLYLDRRAAEGIWRASDVQRLAKDVLKEIEAPLDEGDRGRLAAASDKILSRLTSASLRGRSIAAFADAGDRDGFWAADLAVALPQQARWEESPHVRPLLEALEGRERWAVVLVDRARARLFTIFAGEIEEERDAFNPEPVQHVAATGRDQALTDTQPRADQHARAHEKHVASILEALERERRFDRLILAGPTEGAHGLRDVLPPRIVSRIASIVHLPIEAPERDVLDRTLEIELELAGIRQLEDVRELQTASAKEDRAAAGVGRTLEAVREGRVRRLLYVDGLTLAGTRCEACGSLFSDSPPPAERCAYCGGAARAVPDLIEAMAERTARSGGRIEPVAGAADFLRGFGGIGAFLRF